MNFQAAAIDVGFGQTKWAVRLDEEIITGSFPSLAPISNNNTVTTNLANFVQRNTIKVTVDGDTFEIGPDVRLAMGSSNSGRALSEDFPKTKNYKALLLGALFYAGIDRVDILTLGLPVHTMGLYANHLKDILGKEVEVNGRPISIGRVVVIPQPVGSLAMFGSINGSAINDGHTRLVIDPGYVTTDWVVSSGYNMIDARSGGRVGGVSHVLKQIAELISDKYQGGKLDRIERIDEAFVTRKSFNYFKHVISQTELGEYLSRSTQIIEETVKEIKTRVGDVEDLQSILITGGGAKFYEPIVRSTFPMNDIQVLDNPAFTNAIGFLLVGESMKRRAEKNG
ncbi:PRTRC system protein D [Undibacterium sp. RTI2.1]|uniref:PRTRC system protein D n=1 Tax=unclassified Undibacterium TaxID=2630295 RepID=UPI002AB3CCF4|nr:MULTISPECIES: PRTRC system protein D [unclassified Undibacterium]MDY7540770.1 PRTRC system protein D [Undibacterium sp. 5I1]MEB0032297.1 PRTRC system protein D [Undibacterium sp. RTI2.1]MEB0118440.1 PRTRC system protein D [Undibacterium sp. RTI2.2]MEB0233200.1 PRTRC system protein D [Undibacterium sp. 10I3]MEB0259426.1 PRTRC system protein D [Undibacterium sp. 5I1]